MGIGPAGIAFNAEHPFPQLIVISDFSAAKETGIARVSRFAVVSEGPIRESPGGSRIPTDVETGPVVHGLCGGRLVDRRLGDHGSASPGRGVGDELIAKAAIQAPALDVVSRPIVPPQITNPARARKLCRDAQAKLAIGPQARGRDRRAEGRKGRAYRSEIARQTRSDLSLEFVKHAGGGERLQNHIAGRNGCAYPHTQTSQRALDVVDGQDPRRDEPRSGDNSPRDIHRIDPRS